MGNEKEIADAAYNYALRFNVQSHNHRSHRLGTFGPASPVRRIDPMTGEVMADQDVNLRLDPTPVPRARSYQHRRRWRD